MKELLEHDSYTCAKAHLRPVRDAQVQQIKITEKADQAKRQQECYEPEIVCACPCSGVPCYEYPESARYDIHYLKLLLLIGRNKRSSTSQNICDDYAS